MLDEAVITRTDALDEFAEVVHALHTQLSRLSIIDPRRPHTTPVGTEAGPVIPLQPTEVPQVPKRSRQRLLPPSPERRTKRKDSHAPF